jgi:hypothetical protein
MQERGFNMRMLLRACASGGFVPARIIRFAHEIAALSYKSGYSTPIAFFAILFEQSGFFNIHRPV